MIAITLNNIVEKEYDNILGVNVINKFFVHIKGNYYQPLHQYLKMVNKFPLINPTTTYFKEYMERNYESTIDDIITIANESEEILVKIHKFLLTGEQDEVIDTFYDTTKFSAYELRKIIMEWYLHHKARTMTINYNNKKMIIDAKPNTDTNSLLDTYSVINYGSLIYTLLLSTQPEGDTQVLTITGKLLKTLHNTHPPLSEAIDYTEIKPSELQDIIEKVDYTKLDLVNTNIEEKQLISAGTSINYKTNELNTLIFNPTQNTSIKTLYRLNNIKDIIPGEYYLVKIPKKIITDIALNKTLLRVKLENNIEIIVTMKERIKLIEWFTS